MLFLLTAILFDASTTAGVLRPLPRSEKVADVAWPASTIGCDDGTDRGTLIQRGDLFYGNRLQAPCAGARLGRIAFVHAGGSGPSAYRLHVLDAACNAIGVTPVLFTTESDATPHLEEIDVAAHGWCVQGEFRVFVEPLTCAQAFDCFPALVVDGGTGADCAEVAVPAGSGRSCLTARTSDGRSFAFRIRAGFDCGTPACTSAVVSNTWTAAKQIYRSEPAARP